jgi:hypothetical protein
MEWKKITKYVTFGLIPLLILSIIIYDVVAIIGGDTEASISSLIISMSYQMPFMVYIFGLFNGLLVGHLFWRMKSNEDTKKIDKKKKKKKNE